MPPAPDAARLVRSSSLAVLTWVGRDGRPHGTGVLALTRDAVPVVALPFSRAALAETLDGRGTRGRVGRVALALVERRGTGPGFRPAVIAADPRLIVDTTGDLYVEELVVEELRRYPPARLLADSPLLMREHWWWLPRLVVELPDPQVGWLGEPDDAVERGQVLVALDGSAPRVTRVEASPDPGSPRRLAISPAGGPEPIEGPAVVVDQDGSFPDLERWAEWCWRGRLRNSVTGWVLDVDEAPERIGAPPPLRLLERWRRHRRLERACREGLARWEARDASPDQ
jgi:hypothetical protein